MKREIFMPAGLPIARVTRGETVDRIFAALAESRGGWLLTATVDYLRQCTEDSELLKIGAVSLKRLLDDDPRMGYTIQSKISEIYFRRYIETMRKLQSIVMNIPLESTG